MTDATLKVARVRAHRRSRVARWNPPLGRIQRVAYVLLALQLAGFIAWSCVLYEHFALTIDFTEYQQAWFQIAHGDLNPYMTQTSFWFWQNHCELIMWVLALFYWVWPHPVTLLWLQDLFVAGAEFVALTWICELAGRGRMHRDRVVLAATGILLVLVNPWVWWSLSWDYHSEPSGLFFALLLARDLSRGRRRAWVWLPIVLMCGDVCSTYVIAIGVGAVLSGRRYLRPGLGLVAAGAFAFGVITAIHGNLGSGGGLTLYGYLAGPAHHLHPTTSEVVKGMVEHPGNVLNSLWAKRVDIWANIAPSGVLGLAFSWFLPLIGVILTENNLYPNLLFTAPGFQNLALYLTLPIGTIAVLGWIMRRRRWVGVLVAVALALQAASYSAVWLPRAFSQWMRVSGPAAATLGRVLAQIPEQDEVMATQGVLGRFADRRYIHALYHPGPQPVSTRQLWIVIAPGQGLDAMPTAASMQLIAELAGPLHAQLMTHANGVWAFRWNPPAGTKSLIVPRGAAPLPAWVSAGNAGTDVTSGPAADWRLISDGRRGYVTDGIEWLSGRGTYTAAVTLSTSGPVNVEVWNDTCNSLLMRRSVPQSAGTVTVTAAVQVQRMCTAPVFTGWGPFRAAFLSPPAGQRLEIRVWSPGGETVDVYRAALTPAR